MPINRMTNGYLKPYLFTWLIPKIKQNIIIDEIRAPDRSRCVGPFALISFLRKAMDIIRMMSPIGTRIKKMDRQFIQSSNIPPSTGPMINPKEEKTLRRPNPFPLSWGGKASTTIALPADRIMAAPRAWMVRKKMSCPIVWARELDDNPTQRMRVPKE